MSLYNVEDGMLYLWYVVEDNKYGMRLAEEEENISGHRSISLDRKQDCEWSIDSIE